ncbi:head GIN domain-containing protein [Flavobacterium sp.]
MIKFIIFCVKVISAVVIGVLVTSCNGKTDFGNSITGSGKVVTEVRNVDSFDKVTVCCGLECEIEQSDVFKVTVEADDNLINDISTRVENGTLIISTNYSNFLNVSSRKIKVKMPIIKSIESTSGATLTASKVIRESSVSLKTSSGSEMNVNIESDTLRLEATSGSEQKIRGKALVLLTASSSGSTIDAEDLLANEVSAQSTSGSSTDVNPLVSLKAKASSGSSIEYKKTPKTVNKEESSGGSVSKD